MPVPWESTQWPEQNTPAGVLSSALSPNSPGALDDVERRDRPVARLGEDPGRRLFQLGAYRELAGLAVPEGGNPTVSGALAAVTRQPLPAMMAALDELPARAGGRDTARGGSSRRVHSGVNVCLPSRVGRRVAADFTAGAVGVYRHLQPSSTAWRVLLRRLGWGRLPVVAGTIE